jgi:hypothetical protein
MKWFWSQLLSCSLFLLALTELHPLSPFPRVCPRDHLHWNAPTKPTSQFSPEDLGMFVQNAAFCVWHYTLSQCRTLQSKEQWTLYQDMLLQFKSVTQM